MLGVQDIAIHTLCGEFVTDHSLASNTILLNLWTRQWDQELLDIFSVKRSHLCDLIAPGSICGLTNSELTRKTGIPAAIPVISAGVISNAPPLASVLPQKESSNAQQAPAPI